MCPNCQFNRPEPSDLPCTRCLCVCPSYDVDLYPDCDDEPTCSCDIVDGEIGSSLFQVGMLPNWIFKPEPEDNNYLADYLLSHVHA